MGRQISAEICRRSNSCVAGASSVSGPSTRQTPHERCSLILTQAGADAQRQRQTQQPSAACRPCLVHTCQVAAGAARADLGAVNLAIDSKRRGCDLVAPNGCAIDRTNVRQSKTARPIRFEPTQNDPAGIGRRPAHQGATAWSMLVSEPSRPRSASVDAPVRSPRRRVGQRIGLDSLKTSPGPHQD